MNLCKTCGTICPFDDEHEECEHYKPMTNEDWLRSCTTEQLAEFIADVCYGLLDDVWGNDGDTSCDYRETEKNYWLEWLKDIKE